MEQIIQRLSRISKKYLLLALAIPILLGGVGWSLPVGKSPSTYTAQALINLGSYGNDNLNQSTQVVLLLTHAPFYKNHLPRLSEQKRTEIMENLHVKANSDGMIRLSYSDKTRKGAVQVVNEVTDAFMKLDRKTFDKKNKIIEGTISNLKTMKVDPKSEVNREKFLYQLENKQLNMQTATLLQSANDSGVLSQGTSLSSKDRAVLGIGLGISLIVVFFFLPLFFREMRE